MRLLVFASLLILCAASPAIAAASNAYIKLQLDSTEVFSGDTIVLDVESTGLLDPIDLDVLAQNTTLLRETTGTRIAVIGGKVQEIAIRRMDLLPKRTGVLVIGPLISGDIVSNSVHIKVLDATRPQWTPKDADAQINISLTPDKAVVNQQMLFTVELLHRYPINSETIVLPTLEGFSKRSLIENRRTFAGEKNEWFRTQWQMLVYPRRSGEINIDATQWSGTLAKSNVERADFSRTEAGLVVTVQSAANDGWWLPAGAVDLAESWSSPPTELRAGDELERTITITARDVLSGQIPVPTVPESRALKQQLIHSSRDESIIDHTVVSNATFTYRVTAQSPIPVFLDTVRIPWWDTSKEALREAIIPARRINVGLPDRADVLSKLALQETSINRLQHRLQAAGPIPLISLFGATIAAAYLMWCIAPALWRRLIFRRQINRHIRQLQQLAHSGNALRLYQRLQQPDSKRLLQGTDRLLVTRLERALFCNNSIADIDASLLDSWLKPVIRQAKQLSITTTSAPRLLAEI